MASSPPSESVQGLRKKQKTEASEFQTQIDELEKEISTVKTRLDAIDESADPVHAVAKECIEMKQLAAVLKCKLAEHSHWVQQIASLAEASPLLELAVRLDTKPDSQPADGNVNPRLDLQLSSAKRQETQVLLDGRLQGAIEKCQASASQSLDDAMADTPSSNAPLRFESRGWEFATRSLMNNHVGFRCCRQLSGRSTHLARDVAMAMWDFVQRDEVFRTFIPLVVDSTTIYQKEHLSLSRRVLQLGSDPLQVVVATVESMMTRNEAGQPKEWQISLEAVHDPYLCAFVAEAFRESNVSSLTPPTKRDVGAQMSKLDMHSKFALSARVTEVREGTAMVVVGSAQWDLSHCHDPAFSLLQFVVGRVPVFEDIHLSAKAATSAQ